MEFKACKVSIEVSVRETGVVDHRWRPPDHDSLKLNVDASLLPNYFMIRVSGVIRDHKGLVLRAFAQ